MSKQVKQLLRENEKILGPLNKKKIEKGNFVGSINVSQLSKASNREQQVLFLIEVHAFKLYEGPLYFFRDAILRIFFSLIRDSWYKSILRAREFVFWLFREREILFWISRDEWKGQIVLHGSVIRKGIARGPLYMWSVNR